MIKHNHNLSRNDGFQIAPHSIRERGILNRQFALLIMIVIVFFLPVGSVHAQEISTPTGPTWDEMKEALVDDALHADVLSWRTEDIPVATPAAPETVSPADGARSPATRLGFQSYRDGAWMIYYAAEDGSGQTPFVSAGSNARPKTHPWKSGFLYASGPSGQLDIYFAEVGLLTKQLTNAGGNDLMPAWNQNGSRIVFVSDRDGQVDLWVMNADGSGQGKLTHDAVVDVTPAWSPNGQEIVWVRVGAGGNALWIMNADGSTPRPLTPELPYLASPTWSPDSSRIAFSLDGDGDVWSEIWLINRDGSGAYPLYDPASDLVDAIAGTWSNDGNWLLFTRIEYVVYNQQLYLKDTFIERVGLSGGATQRLTSTGRDLYPDIRGLDTVPPETWMEPLPTYSRTETTVLRWGGIDTMSGLARAQPYGSSTPDGSYDPILNINGLTYEDNVAVSKSLYSGAHYFKVVASDRAGNVSSLPGTPQASTTFYDGLYVTRITDNRGIPVPDRPVAFRNAGGDAAILLNEGEQQTNSAGIFRGILGNGFGSTILNDAQAATNPLYIPWRRALGHTESPEIKVYEIVGANPIENNGFEESDTSWQLTGDAVVPTAAPIAHRGKTAAVLGADECPSLICFDRPTTLATGNESDIVMDDQGTVHVLLVSRKAGAQGVYYLSKATQSDWTSPTQIGDGAARQPALAVDRWGTLHGIWQAETGQLWFASKPRTEGWGIPINLGQGRYSDIAVDGTGGVHVVYERLLPCAAPYCNIGLHYQSRSPQGAWATPILLDSQDDADAFHASVAAAGDGTVHVAWIRRPPVDDSGGYLSHGTKLMFRSRLPGGNWADLAMLWSVERNVRSNLRAQVAVDERGLPTVYFMGGYENWFFSKDALGNWARSDLGSSAAFADRTTSPAGVTHHLAYVPLGNEYEILSANAVYDLITRRGDRLPAWQTPDSIYAPGGDGDPTVKLLLDSQDALLAFYNDLRDPNNPRLRAMVPTVAPAAATGVAAKAITVPDVSNPTLTFFYTLLAGMPTSQSVFSVIVSESITETTAFSTTTTTPDWTLGWVDLSPWKGQEITVSFAFSQAQGEPFVHLYLDDVSLSPWLTPVTQQISPSHLEAGVVNSVTITGLNFWDGIAVTLELGDQSISPKQVNRQDAQILTVDLPALGPGTYDLRLEAPGGQQSVWIGAIQVGDPAFLPLLTRCYGGTSLCR